MSEESNKFKDMAERREKIEARYDAQAKRNFSKPANFCQFCGREIERHEDPMTDRWQQRWSIHHNCANSVDNHLDRSVGILSERKQ